jgi:dipeptidase D
VTLQSKIDEMVMQFDRLYANRDNGIQVELTRNASAVGSALSVPSSSVFLQMLQAIPTGICEMTPEILNLVESSCNMAIIDLVAEGAGTITCSVRGTTPEALGDVSASIIAIAALGQGTVKVADGYPGWKPHLDSPLLKAAIDSYERLFGEKPKVHAIHAGLECGLLIEKMPGLHAISIGPTIKGNHAVGERVSTSSVAKSYKYLVEILTSLSGKTS